MICQRCGNCCITMPVIIPVPTEEGLRMCRKLVGKCPNLSFDEHMEASCAVHDLPEYEGSPCWTYGNSDVDPDFYPQQGRPCRVGQYIKSNGGPKWDREFTTDELEDFGPWPEKTP